MKKLLLTVSCILTLNVINAQFIKKRTIDSKNEHLIDERHEQDDLLFRDSSLVIFLNQTSIVTDTIYVYKIAKLQQCKGITKENKQCKRRQEDKFCFQHKN